MLTQSFRVASERLVACAALLVTAVILAGCGGSGAKEQPAQSLRGSGFSFDAPAGWRVERSHRRVTAANGTELLEVASFPLLRPYSNSLFGKVEKELAARMRQIAGQSGGTVSGPSTVTTGDTRAHSYQVKSGDTVDEYTFVLRGLHEFQLLCRRQASSSGDTCKQLLASFAVS
jgi:hypothetical protein